MKYRVDYVTNSSSSSFICDVCGEHAEGWDISLSDAGMYECENGHTICEDEITEEPNYREFLESVVDESDKIKLLNMNDSDCEDMAMDYEFRYYLPEKYCPICSFQVYSERDMTEYLLKKYNVPKDEVFQEVKKSNKRRKKLYDSEYVSYVCSKLDLDTNKLIEEIKNTYKTYSEFKKFLNS